MSKIEAMSMQAIIDRIGIPNMGKRAYYIFKNFQLADEFLKIIQEEEQPEKHAKKFLISHEGEIDKEKLLLVAAIEEEEKIKSQGLTTIPENKRRIMNLGKGVNTFLTTCEYSEESGYTIIVFPAKSFLRKNQTPENYNRERWNHLKKDLKPHGINLESVFRFMFTTDIMEMLPEGKKTLDVLEYTNKEAYEKFVRSSGLTGFAQIVENNLEYINWDKLLLMLAYRCKEHLEIETQKKTMFANFCKVILQKLYHALKDNRHAKLQCDLQQRGTTQMHSVSFDVEDLQQCIKQITSEGYLTDKALDHLRQQITNRETTLLQMPREEIRACYSERTLLDTIPYSEDNLRYVLRTIEEENPNKVSKLLQRRKRCSLQLVEELLDGKKIKIEHVVQLYGSNRIDIDVIKHLKEKYDFSDQIDFSNLNRFYQIWQEDPENKKKENEYRRCLVFYKEVKIEGQSKEKIEQNAKEVKKYLDAHSKNDKKRKNAILNYYQEEILPFHLVRESFEQNELIALCNQGKIRKEDQEQLVQEGILQADYLSNQYMSRILNGEFQERKEIIELLYTGVVAKENIGDLLLKGFIGINDLDILVERDFITLSEKEELESNFDFMKALNSSGHGYGMKPMEKFSIQQTNTDYIPRDHKEKRPKIIIDPKKRQEFFAALGLSNYVFDEDVSPDNPFYHYNFYVKIDENGNPLPDSPVIAERFYEDKNTKRSFATENATYIFRAKDYFVLNRYAGKSEAIQEKKGEIYKSNHVLASEKGKGHWATSVINNFMRIVIGPELEEYDEKKQALKIIDKMKEMYSFPSLKRIYTYEWEIDQGEHLLIEEAEKKKSPSDDTEGYSL